MIKKLSIGISLILVLAIALSSTVISAFAKNEDVSGKASILEKIDKSELSSDEKTKIKDLIKKYNLKAIDVKDVPADVKAGEANNSAELEKLLIEGRKTVKDIKSNRKEAESTSNSSAAEIEAQTNSTEKDSYYVGPNYYFHLDVTYTYLWSSSRNSNYISSVNSKYSYLTGTHPLIGWTESFANGWPINNGYGIHAECLGTWDTYIFVPGIGSVLVNSTADSWAWDHYFVP